MIADNILQHVSYSLIEPYINTALGTGIGAGVNTVTPTSVAGIYVGAQLIVGGANPEVITVTAVTPTQITALFVNAHLNTDPLFGATFPSGETDHALFTQTEMLGYLADVQNEFLLKVRPVYFINIVAVAAGIRFYSQPADAIRMEHVSIESVALRNSSQDDLDLDNPGWPNQAGAVTHWFQDQINNQMYGFKFTPSINDAAEIWYSQRAAQTLGLMDTLLVPDIFCQAGILKYGVLSRCFSKDGEQRDPYRADFCDKMFKFGISLAYKFMQGVDAALSTGQPQPMPTAQDFNPFAVPQLPQGQQAATTPFQVGDN